MRDWETDVSTFAADKFELEEEVGFFALSPGSVVNKHNGGTNLRLILSIHIHPVSILDATPYTTY